MMDTVYFELVINSMRTCDENNKTLPMVPNRHLAAVLAMLEKDGRDANGKIFLLLLSTYGEEI